MQKQHSSMKLRSGTVISMPRADKKSELEKKAQQKINDIQGVFKIFVDEFNKVTSSSDNDSLMEKMRIVIVMYRYANTISEKKMLHHRLKSLRTTMLKQCVNFSKDANRQIKIRIKDAQEKVKNLTSESSHNYYMAHLNAMQTELDQFTTTYANRI